MCMIRVFCIDGQDKMPFLSVFPWINEPESYTVKAMKLVCIPYHSGDLHS